MAVVLIVAGAFFSPQGDGLEPRPPNTVWTASTAPGRAPGVWVLGDRPVVAAADGLTAFEPATGEQAWTVPFDDPACTGTDEALTCVDGRGEAAAVVTVDATGAVDEQRFRRADVAARIGADLIVAGRTEDGFPWLTRVPAGANQRPVWRYEAEHPLNERIEFVDLVVSQGIITANTIGARLGGPDVPWAAFAVDADTGEPRTAVVNTFGTMLISNPDPDGDEGAPLVLPLPGEELAITGHPDAVVTEVGVIDSETGAPIRQQHGLPLSSLGDDLVVADSESRTDQGAAPAMWIERVHALTGEERWRRETERPISCPCAMTPRSIVLAESSVDEEDPFTLVPEGLQGLDASTGQPRWYIPVDSAPDGVAAGTEQVYVLSAGILTAYADE